MTTVEALWVATGDLRYHADVVARNPAPEIDPHLHAAALAAADGADLVNDQLVDYAAALIEGAIWWMGQTRHPDPNEADRAWEIIDSYAAVSPPVCRAMERINPANRVG